MVSIDVVTVVGGEDRADLVRQHAGFPESAAVFGSAHEAVEAIAAEAPLAVVICVSARFEATRLVEAAHGAACRVVWTDRDPVAATIRVAEWAASARARAAPSGKP